MLLAPKSAKIIKVAACLFIMSAAIFLSVDFALAAAADLGINYGAGTGLSNATDIRIIIANIIRVIIGFLGIVAVGLIMYAGWLWMTSEGNEDKIDQAKKLLTNAVIGLIIILSSFAIATFILNKLSGGGAGGQNQKNAGSPGSYGLSATENGAIAAVYPERGQKDVPRNTALMITFRQPVASESLIAGAINNNQGIFSGALNTDSVKIGKSGDSQPLAMAFTVATKDNLTFVFSPAQYLGSPNEKIWYSVSLSLSNIKNKADGKAIVNPWNSWTFQISDKIDLTPPQVLTGGVFPAPDAAADTALAGSPAKQATGEIQIKSRPAVYSDASVASVITGSGSGATAAVDKNCAQSGAMKAEVDATGVVKLTDSGNKLLGQGSVRGQTALFSICNLKLTLNSGSFSAGNLWTVNVKAMTAADTVAVGGAVYTAGADFEAVADLNATAKNLADALAANPDVSATASGATVKLTAKAAGVSGNSIALASSNTGKISISAMAGGLDKDEAVTVNGAPDAARNAVIRIDFNEAVNPLAVSGKSDEVKDYIQVVNLSANPATVVAGNFKISNQFKTVEFLSNDQCGVNACGEKIYCLPGNSNLKVLFKAAALADCGADNCLSRSPYTACSGNCKDANGYNYPLAAAPLNGVADLAANSLDGNRDGKAQGQGDPNNGNSYYNENIAGSANGDNFMWSFFTNDKIDLAAPEIILTEQADKEGKERSINNGSNLELYNPIVIYFNKLMMSSSLGTGETVTNNGPENITHKLINMWNFTNKPLGYWITNENIDSGATPDGIMDRTKVYINHTGMVDATAYRAQAGSGVKDIYQNCYKPSGGYGCSGGDSVTDELPSCCSGQRKGDVLVNGNCP